jgi:hypothetical protein
MTSNNRYLSHYNALDYQLLEKWHISTLKT